MAYVKDVFKVAHVPVDFEEIALDASSNEAETAEFELVALTSMHRNGVGIKVIEKQKIFKKIPAFLGKHSKPQHVDQRKCYTQTGARSVRVRGSCKKLP